MDIFEEVKKLNLPLGEYVVVGSGPMAARGIRDYKDIDILVTKNLYSKLIKQSWKTVEINGVNGKFEVLKNDKFEVDKKLWCGNYKPDTENLIKSAEIINGVPFLLLKELIKFKKALGREKDLKDIILIENYLNKGISVEKFLDYICGKYGFLLHGSIHEIKDKIKSKDGKIFTSNKAAIAIMRSIYSNIGVNLKYPYFIDKNNPLILEIYTPKNGKFVSAKRGFVYILNKKGFKNDPEGSWQFIKKGDESEFLGVIRTRNKNFKYPVRVYKDLKGNSNRNIKISDVSPGDERGIILLLKKTWLATYPNKKYNITKEDILRKD